MVLVIGATEDCFILRRSVLILRRREMTNDTKKQMKPRLNEEVEKYVRDIAQARRQIKSVLTDVFGSELEKGPLWDQDDLNAVWDAYVESCFMDVVLYGPKE